MKIFSSPEDVHALVGASLGSSGWVEIDADRVRLFADATGDHHWLHFDGERAATTPFGGPIAHGFLLLSLIAEFSSQIYQTPASGMLVNYGVEHVRFTSAVRIGEAVRAHATLTSVEDFDGGTLLRVSYVIERGGADKPACVATHLQRAYF